MKKICLLLFICLSLFVGYKVKAYDAYQIGDAIKYRNYDYYVIEDSGADQEFVTVIRNLPLTKAEIMSISPDNETLSAITADNGKVKYCVEENGCIFNFSGSLVNSILNGWATAFEDDLEMVHEVTGQNSSKARLLNQTDLQRIDSNFNSGDGVINASYAWLYGTNLPFWLDGISSISMLTYSVIQDSTTSNIKVATVSSESSAYIKPVIRVKKSATTKVTEQDSSNSDEKSQVIPDNSTNTVTKSDNNKKVKVDNTLLKQSIITIVLGITIIIVGITIYVVNKKRK